MCCNEGAQPEFTIKMKQKLISVSIFNFIFFSDNAMMSRDC
jgi:hypothetical protein